MIEEVIWVNQVTTARENPNKKRENRVGKYLHSHMQKFNSLILLKADPELAHSRLCKRITWWGKKSTKIWGTKFRCWKNRSLTIFHKLPIMQAFQSWRAWLPCNKFKLDRVLVKNKVTGFKKPSKMVWIQRKLLRNNSKITQNKYTLAKSKPHFLTPKTLLKVLNKWSEIKMLHARVYKQFPKTSLAWKTWVELFVRSFL